MPLPVSGKGDSAMNCTPLLHLPFQNFKMTQNTLAFSVAQRSTTANIVFLSQISPQTPSQTLQNYAYNLRYFSFNDLE